MAELTPTGRRMAAPNAISVGCLTIGSPSADQREAYEWCRSVVDATETVEASTVTDGDVDLSSFDVVWWHATEPYTDPGQVIGLAGPVGDHLDRGGGLVLTHRALSSVAALDIDPVPPDSTGVEPVEEPVGQMCVRVHADHPIFAPFEGLRTHTRPPGGDQSFARYENLLPAKASTLASTVRGVNDVPHQRSILEWHVGRGTVLGIGSGLAFEAWPFGAGVAANAGRLVQAALSYCSTPSSRRSSLAGTPPLDPYGEAAHRTLRERIVDEPQFPSYHVAPPGNWLNDPNGLLYWNGRYHVFYQYNPSGPFHATVHWGHVVSEDLVTWTDMPVAMAPDPDGPDRDGCWSGCAVVDDGVPSIVYTGGRSRVQLPCVATAMEDDLTTWDRHPDNPVIPGPPSELDLRSTDDWTAEFRDHSVWHDGEAWYQLIGSGIQDVGGTALLYRGESLTDWTHLGPLLVGDDDGDGAVWECPELLRFDDAELLQVSNGDDVLYFVGEFDADRPGFKVDARGLFDHGDFYAPQSLRAPDGRVVTFGWLPEPRTSNAQWDAGWSGALSVPRELRVEDGRLCQRPAAEVADLRGRQLSGGQRVVGPHDEPTIARGRALDLTARVDLGSADELAVVAFASPDGAERTPIRLRSDELLVDRPQSGGLRPEAGSLSMPVDATGPTDLRVLVDRSIVEIFVDDRRALAARVYPERDDSDRLELSATGGTATLSRLSVYSMTGCWSGLDDGRTRRRANDHDPSESADALSDP
jgi:beta-fructofuranosidase